MKNKAKRIVSAVCALAMCAAMLPAAAFADEPTADSSIQVMSDEKQMDLHCLWGKQSNWTANLLQTLIAGLWVLQ